MRGVERKKPHSQAKQNKATPKIFPPSMLPTNNPTLFKKFFPPRLKIFVPLLILKTKTFFFFFFKKFFQPRLKIFVPL